MKYVTTIEELREELWDDRNDYLEMMVDRIDEDTTPFQLGRYRGYVDAMDEVLMSLRNAIKYAHDVDDQI